ncbi:MAG: ABC transporter permease [Actinobacteria bacterium]|nr:ABC transporter permease [Actinomycetota bacterium]
MFVQMLRAQFAFMWRNRGALIASLLFPAFFAFMFGLGTRAQERPSRVGVVSESQSETSDQFVVAMREHDFEVFPLADAQDLQEDFADMRLNIVVIVPDLQDGGTVRVLFDERFPENLVQTLARIRSLTERFNLDLAGGEERVRFSVRGLRGDPLPTFQYLLPSIIMFSVIFPALSFGGMRAIQSREKGVFKRLMVTPLAPRTFLVTEMIARGFLVAVQTLIVLLVGLTYNSPIHPESFWLFVLALMGALIFISLGFFVSSFGRSPETVGGILTLSGFVLIFLSGGLPLSTLPARVTEAVKYLPISPMVNAIRGVILEGTSPFEAAPLETVILSAWFLITLALAVLFFRFKEPAKR